MLANTSKSKRAIAFIDASNLFYGGEKSLGWKIDYRKLAKYLKKKYKVREILYFGGVEISDFPYDYLQNDTIPLNEFKEYLLNVSVYRQQLQRVKFYLKLKSFGYRLYLKPVKLYRQVDGTIKKKANCDVEMAFHLMREKENFDKAVILSGDGDFLPILKHLREAGKEVIILARGARTSKEVRQFAGSNFRDFVRLEKELRFQDK